MKYILYITLLVSFVFSQGLNLNDLETGKNGKQMYPYSGKTLIFIRMVI